MESDEFPRSAGALTPSSLGPLELYSRKILNNGLKRKQSRGVIAALSLKDPVMKYNYAKYHL